MEINQSMRDAVREERRHLSRTLVASIRQVYANDGASINETIMNQADKHIFSMRYSYVYV